MKTEGFLATELQVVLVGAAVVMVVGRVVVKFGVVVFVAVVVTSVEANVVLLRLVTLVAEIATHHHYISLHIKSILSMSIN